MAIKAIIFTTGYVESASVGSLVFFHKDDGIEGRYEAVKSLSNDLFKGFCIDNVSPFTVQCCKRTYDIEYNIQRFCITCGKDLKTITNSPLSKNFIESEFQQHFLLKLIGGTSDDTGSLWMHLEDNAEWIWGSPKGLMDLKKEEVIEIKEYGEEMIASFQHPDLKEEFIGRGHNKEKYTTHEQVVLKYV